MIDRELVTRKIVLILRDLTVMEPLAAKGLTEDLASPVDEMVAERLQERMIGRMIDVNDHLLTQAGRAPPVDYHASFVQLGGIGVVDHEFARRLAAAAGRRNRIVHECDELDSRKVHEALAAAARDIPADLARVDAHVTRMVP